MKALMVKGNRKNVGYAFGSIQGGRNYNTNSYRFGFNGQEKTDEISGNGNHYTALFWEYDTRLGRRWNIDPITHDKPFISPYHAFSNKPILNVDPNGANDNEYEVNGKTGETKKVSDLGGDAINFYHHKGGAHNGQTEIQNTKSCETQWIKSSKNIEGYTRRDNKTDWAKLYTEYKTGVGPEKSLMYGPHPMNIQMAVSPTFIEAMQDFVASGETKYKSAPSFNPISAGTNMTAQFMGKANYNFYQVGDKLVVLVIDSKSITSETFDPIKKNIEAFNKPREAGKVIPESTTHQTYLMILPTTIKRNYQNTGN